MSSEYNARYYAEHRDELITRSRDYQRRPDIRASRKAWRQRNADHLRDAKRTYQAKEWRRVLINAARARAKKLGLPFALTVENITWPEFCPILGLRLDPTPCIGQGRKSDNRPTIDRVVPALGYVPGNVAVISWRANRLKSDARLQDLEAIVRWLKNRSEMP